MYFYSYLANNSIHQVIVDEIGTPIFKRELETTDNINSEIKPKLLTEPNLVVCGVAISDEKEYFQLMATGKTKEPVYLYLDESPEKMEDFKSDEEWETFFEENEIQKHISQSPYKYIFH